MHTEVLSFQYSEISQSLITLGTDSRYQHEEGKFSISLVHVCLNWVSFSLSVASLGSYSITSNFDLVWKWFFPRFVSLPAKFQPEIWPTGSSALNQPNFSCKCSRRERERSNKKALLLTPSQTVQFQNWIQNQTLHSDPSATSPWLTGGSL